MSNLISRRTLCAGLAATAATSSTLTASLPALAQTWPRQALRVIVPAPAGSAPDVMMRMISDKISAQLGKPVVVDNRPGAGGTVGMQALDSARDEHTLIFMLTGFAVLSPLLLKSARYDVLRDFQPVVGMAESTVMMVTAPTAPAKTIPEIVKLARQTPNSLVIGHSGPGTLSHFTVESFVQSSKAKFNVVGFSPTTGVPAIVNGDAQYFVDGVAALLPFVQSGRALPVAVFSPTALPGLEAYRLANESLPGIEGMGRFGLMAAKDFPAHAVATVAAAVAQALAAPDVQARLRDYGTYPRLTDAATYAASIRREQAQWGAVAKAAGILAE